MNHPRPVTRIPRQLPRVALLLSLAAAITPAHATIYCVSTGAQLDSALTSAAGNGADDEIRVVQGTLSGSSKANGSTRWSYQPGANDLTAGLTLSGGWSAGNSCAAQTSNDPQSTVLDAGYIGPVLSVVVNGADPLLGDVVIRNLTLTRGFANNIGEISGFDWIVNGGSTSSLLVENLLVVAGSSNAGSNSAVRISQNVSGVAKARNLIVHDNNGGGANSSGGLSIGATGSAYAVLSNATVYNNHGTSSDSGLSATGVVTLANNAIADNTSTAATTFQFYSPAATGLTLRYNHFGTVKLTGVPSSEIGTTTGDPKWSGVGNVRIPDNQSPLRDSGSNSPLGGLASIDFRGNPRVSNGTVDRGAVEADPVPNVGPTISALSPANASTTTLPGGKATDATFATVSFGAAGGSNQGTTSLVCTVTNGTVKIFTNGSQTVAVGGTPLVMKVYFVLSSQPQTGAVQCVATPTGGLPGTLTYAFQAPAGTLMGPTVIADAPQEGSTTALFGTMTGEILTDTIHLSASGGNVGASTAVDCFEAAGAVTITANKSQVVATGDTPKAIGVAFETQGNAQDAEVRCTVNQQGVANPQLYHFYYTVSASAVLFIDDFE